MRENCQWCRVETYFNATAVAAAATTTTVVVEVKSKGISHCVALLTKIKFYGCMHIKIKSLNIAPQKLYNLHKCEMSTYHTPNVVYAMVFFSVDIEMREK